MTAEMTRLRELFNQSEELAKRQNCLQAAIFGAVFMLVAVSLDFVVYPEIPLSINLENTSTIKISPSKPVKPYNLTIYREKEILYEEMFLHGLVLH